MPSPASSSATRRSSGCPSSQLVVTTDRLLTLDIMPADQPSQRVPQSNPSEKDGQCSPTLIERGVAEHQGIIGECTAEVIDIGAKGTVGRIDLFVRDFASAEVESREPAAREHAFDHQVQQRRTRAEVAILRVVTDL